MTDNKPIEGLTTAALEIRAWIARTRELADNPPLIDVPDLADVMLAAADKVEEYADSHGMPLSPQK